MKGSDTVCLLGKITIPVQYKNMYERWSVKWKRIERLIFSQVNCCSLVKHGILKSESWSCCTNHQQADISSLITFIQEYQAAGSPEGCCILTACAAALLLYVDFFTRQSCSRSPERIWRTGFLGKSYLLIFWVKTCNCKGIYESPCISISLPSKQQDFLVFMIRSTCPVDLLGFYEGIRNRSEFLIELNTVLPTGLFIMNRFQNSYSGSPACRENSGDYRNEKRTDQTDHNPDRWQRKG